MTQTEKVKDYMNRHGSISTFEAFRYLNITRLSARIADLRKAGVLIVSTHETKRQYDVETGKEKTVTYCVYRIADEEALA